MNDTTFSDKSQADRLRERAAFVALHLSGGYSISKEMILAADEIERLQAIVDNAPKDADGDPVEDGKAYFFKCVNGALEWSASTRPQIGRLRPYPWNKAHKTREAAEAAKETTVPHLASER